MDMELDRLWGLILELSAQLTQNRAQCDALRQQADSLKQQAIHVGTGFTLRRFNVDISKEIFESELEKLNATIVCENHNLQHENKQLTILLKDYESTVESLMGKFRTFAHSTQMHELAMTQHYEALLAKDAAERSYPPDLVASPDMSRLSNLLVKALRSMQGENPSPPGTPTEGDISRGGGYLALLGSLSDGRDEALESEIERERLLKENLELRALLGITEDLPSSAEAEEPFARISQKSPAMEAAFSSSLASSRDADLDEMAPLTQPPEFETPEEAGQPILLADEESAIAD